LVKSAHVAYIQWDKYTGGSMKFATPDDQTRYVISDIWCRAHLLALSPGGTQMASASGGEIQLWSVATGECLARLGLSKESWHISTPFLNHDSSNNVSLPMVYVPTHQQTHEEPSRQLTFAPITCYRYQEDDEWIVDWDAYSLPPDRRAYSLIMPMSMKTSDVHDKKVAIAPDAGQVYIVDFSDMFSSWLTCMSILTLPQLLSNLTI
jgi:hypothetical protein